MGPSRAACVRLFDPRRNLSEPAASAAAAATLKAFDYQVFELAASGASQEVQVLVGPYADLDQARQVEAQLRARWQFRQARIVASPSS